MDIVLIVLFSIQSKVPRKGAVLKKQLNENADGYDDGQ